jgi:hypothetical protein
VAESPGLGIFVRLSILPQSHPLIALSVARSAETFTDRIAFRFHLHNVSEERSHLIPGKQILMIALFLLFKKKHRLVKCFSFSEKPDDNLAAAIDVMERQLTVWNTPGLFLVK